MGRQEKVTFYIILYLLPCLVLSPPEWPHLDQDGGNNVDLHLDTPQSPRIMVIPHMEMERDRQQESACGFLSLLGWVLSLLGFFPFYF